MAVGLEARVPAEATGAPRRVDEPLEYADRAEYSPSEHVARLRELGAIRGSYAMVGRGFAFGPAMAPPGMSSLGSIGDPTMGSWSFGT